MDGVDGHRSPGSCCTPDGSEKEAAAGLSRFSRKLVLFFFLPLSFFPGTLEKFCRREIRSQEGGLGWFQASCAVCRQVTQTFASTLLLHIQC